MDLVAATQPYMDKLGDIYIATYKVIVWTSKPDPVDNLWQGTNKEHTNQWMEFFRQWVTKAHATDNYVGAVWISGL